MLTDQVKQMAETSSNGRARIYEKLETMERKWDRTELELRAQISGLAERLDNVEPFAEEYKRTKEQVRGAGALGRWLWTIGGLVLTAAVSIYSAWDAIVRFFSK